MHYYLLKTGGRVTTSHPTIDPGRVECTKEQYDYHEEYRIVDGVIIDRDDAELLQLEKTKRHALIVTQAQALLAVLVEGYPAAEVSTWAQQHREASAWAHDHKTETPLLTTIAGSPGARDVLARNVLAYAADHNTAAGAIIAARRVAQQAVDDAGTVEAVRAITL